MNTKMKIWILSLILLAGTAHAQTDPESWPNLLFSGAIFYIIAIALYKWLKKDNVPGQMHLLAAAIAAAMALAAAQAEFSILNLILAIGEMIWLLIKSLISSWIGVIIIGLLTLLIVAASKGWIKIKFGKTFLFLTIALTLFMITAWYVYTGEITIPTSISNIPVIGPIAGGGNTIPGGLNDNIIGMIKSEGTTKKERCLIYAVMKGESSFRPYAISDDGAAGLMQLMPYAATTYGSAYGMTTSNIRWFAEGSKNAAERKRYSDELKRIIRRKSHSEIVSIDRRFDISANIKTGSNMLKIYLTTYKDEGERNQILYSALRYHSGDIIKEFKAAQRNPSLMSQFSRNRPKAYRYITRDIPPTYDKCMLYSSFDEYLTKGLNYKPTTPGTTTQPTPTPSPTPSPSGDLSSGAKDFI